MRAEFDANKGEANPKIIEKLVSDGEAKLADFEHPAPYTREPLPAHDPTSPPSPPGGTPPTPGATTGETTRSAAAPLAGCHSAVGATSQPSPSTSC